MGNSNPDEEWRALLTGEHKGVLALRRAFARVPSAPYCKMCHAPFGGIGGLVLVPGSALGSAMRSSARTA